ncbi:hypothetical protein CDD80_6754 [Ophiocordyceps camponoti-rufipedis]|uniref:nitric oxide dioxygenase n=1 Tax=Ophiocordyceps camponoti-rufipedis TaxID=2004952 RepID=A0A2C5ZEN3_9HYPO|nr:hypothetical protein CDD80_6754 [Ophiocordyceps camponoti-rufipedis]
MALTPEQVALVKSTAPLLKEHGTAITSIFYRRMLAARPELNDIFSVRNQRDGVQQAALASAVLAYATYIDDLGRLTGAVERIAQRHASLVVQPEQYAIVGEFLVAAFAEVLGDAVLTPAVVDAWVAAYQQLADVFISRERQLYDQFADWRGWRAFRVDGKEAEAEDVVSLYLRPVDGRVPLPLYRPGQYVSARVRVSTDGGESLQCRQFSLSVAPRHDMDVYRVTVKREDTTTVAIAGLVSNRIHDDLGVGDELELTAPRGEFFFDDGDMAETETSPVVLLSLGVGATPVMSILQSIFVGTDSTDRPVGWVHGARHPGAVCFGRDVAEMAARHSNLRPLIFIKTAGGEALGRYIAEGRLSLERAEAEGVLHLDHGRTAYYICGRAKWMAETRDWLRARGVGEERIHLELFGVGEV